MFFLDLMLPISTDLVLYFILLCCTNSSFWTLQCSCLLAPSPRCAWLVFSCFGQPTSRNFRDKFWEKLTKKLAHSFKVVLCITSTNSRQKRSYTLLYRFCIFKGYGIRIRYQLVVSLRKELKSKYLLAWKCIYTKIYPVTVEWNLTHNP